MDPPVRRRVHQRPPTWRDVGFSATCPKGTSLDRATGPADFAVRNGRYPHITSRDDSSDARARFRVHSTGWRLHPRWIASGLPTIRELSGQPSKSESVIRNSCCNRRRTIYTFTENWVSANDSRSEEHTSELQSLRHL